ncbi:MAG TPA: VOC family protein [Streptosporangiaceae bacterium]|jgi:predicted enzyme related to lactoylglutathione lyase
MRINYVLDCGDADTLAGFWAAALGFERGAWEPPSPYVSLTRPGAGPPEMLLQQVPEPKQGKNRMHLDLRVADSETEVARLVALGARILQGPHDDEGHWTTVLADPEGNEFCVIVSPEDQ